MTSPLDRLASIGREIPVDPSGVSTSGLYFLVSEGVIVYIGQSIDAEMRVRWHVVRSANVSRAGWHRPGTKDRTERKVFDLAFWIRVPVADLNLYESVLIRLLRPRYNKTAMAHVGLDNEVLATLGLSQHNDEQAIADEARRVLWARRYPARQAP